MKHKLETYLLGTVLALNGTIAAAKQYCEDLDLLDPIRLTNQCNSGRPLTRSNPYKNNKTDTIHINFNDESAKCKINQKLPIRKRQKQVISCFERITYDLKTGGKRAKFEINGDEFGIQNIYLLKSKRPNDIFYNTNPANADNIEVTILTGEEKKAKPTTAPATAAQPVAAPPVPAAAPEPEPEKSTPYSLLEEKGTISYVLSTEEGGVSIVVNNKMYDVNTDSFNSEGQYMLLDSYPTPLDEKSAPTFFLKKNSTISFVKDKNYSYALILQNGLIESNKRVRGTLEYILENKDKVKFCEPEENETSCVTTKEAKQAIEKLVFGEMEYTRLKTKGFTNYNKSLNDRSEFRDFLKTNRYAFVVPPIHIFVANNGTTYVLKDEVKKHYKRDMKTCLDSNLNSSTQDLSKFKECIGNLFSEIQKTDYTLKSKTSNGGGN